MNRDFGTLPGAPLSPEPEHKNGTDKRNIIERPRARREAAKALGLAMQQRYRRFLETADDSDENALATAALAQVMYENVEFTIWALKTVAGMNPPPPEVLRPISRGHEVPQPANDDPRFRKPPPVVLEEEKPAVPLTCTCPPMDKELIGANRHMTSCPLFQP